MDDEPISYTLGVAEDERSDVVRILDQAFADKMCFAIPDDAARLKVLYEGLELDCVVGAFIEGRLVGVAGVKSASHAVFAGLTFQLLRKELGFGAIRAALVLAFLDRPLLPGTLHVEFIAVDALARSRGIGTGLLEMLDEVACIEGASRIDLDVVDTNPDALRLYRRLGFEEVRTDSLPIPARWMGFSAATTMAKSVDCVDSAPSVQ